MVDTFVNWILAQGRRIGDRTYYVNWDTKNQWAVISYTQDGREGMRELCDKDDTVLTFPSELKALAYISRLAE